MSHHTQGSARNASRSVLETLESRRHLSADVAPTPTLDGQGIVHITGTVHADNIIITLGSRTTKLDVIIHGRVTTFKTEDVRGIVAIGASGSDAIKIVQSNGKIDIPVTMA